MCIRDRYRQLAGENRVLITNPGINMNIRIKIPDKMINNQPYTCLLYTSTQPEDAKWRLDNMHETYLQDMNSKYVYPNVFMSCLLYTSRCV